MSNTFFGGGGDSNIVGNANDNLIYGGTGNDTLDGSLGNDTVFGEADNDQLYGGAGTDTLFGGENNDVLAGGNDSDTLFGDNGNDRLQGNDGIDYLFGGEGNDFELNGGNGSDIIYGGAGNDNIGDVWFGDPNSHDLIFGGDGRDFAYAGQGNDTIFGEEGPDVLVGGAGNDTVFGGNDNDVVQGTNNDDTLFGDNGDDVLSGDQALGGGEGLPGNDVIYGGEGSDTASYTSANGTIVVDLALGTATGADANDTLFSTENLIGSPFNDTLSGNDNDNTISGWFGADTIYGRGGSDVLYGGDYLGEPGDPPIPFPDLFYGGTGDDHIYGDVGADTLFGGDDRDMLFAGAGDSVDGGTGGIDVDTLDLKGLGPLRIVDRVTDLDGDSTSGRVELLDGSGNVTGTITFSEIENLIPCFTPGAMIDTRCGAVAVQDLRVGDRVLTRDNGFQTIRWIGRKSLGAAALAASPALRPVCIRRDAFGPGVPARDMMVSRQHRMLLTGADVQLHLGETEVLACAAHLAPRSLRPLPALREVTYIHVLFDGHEIVRADGCWTESFQPAGRVTDALDAAVRDEILQIFPELARGDSPPFAAARPTLRAWEARAVSQ